MGWPGTIIEALSTVSFVMFNYFISFTIPFTNDHLFLQYMLWIYVGPPLLIIVLFCFWILYTRKVVRSSLRDKLKDAEEFMKLCEISNEEFGDLFPQVKA